MDGLLVTFLPGVVVAVIGAFAAYYFAVRHERLKQAYEREKDEQRRQEERQAELNKQRAKVFAEIRIRANSIMDALSVWVRRAETLPNLKPPEEEEELLPAEVAWKPYFQEFDWLSTRAFEFENEMSSLRGYYHDHEASLEPTTHSLFRSFDEEICMRFTSVLFSAETGTGDIQESEAMAAGQHVWTGMDTLREARQKLLWRVFPFIPWAVNKRADAGFREGASIIDGIILAAAQELPKDWNLQTYRTKFRNESANYSG